MLKNRVIPVLLLHNNGLVKTVKFKKPKYVGDPVNAIRIFNEKEVDELMIIDISASKERKEPNYEMIENIAGECFMPLAYGGGIQSIEQAKKIFSLGVEKICLQSIAEKNIKLVRDLADRFGSQSIMVSIDIKKNIFGKENAIIASTRKKINISWLTHIENLVKVGAGEVLLNSIDKDGTLSGPDLDIIRQAAKIIEVPLIAVGGISSLSDIKAAVKAGASAVAAGSYFVFYGPHKAVLITYPSYEELCDLFK